MSIATWKRKYYRTAPDRDMEVATAVAHSLTKWEGLTEKARAEHGLVGTRYLKDDDGRTFNVDSTTCALCLVSARAWRAANTKCDCTEEDRCDWCADSTRGNATEAFCPLCPLYVVLGRGCDVDAKAPFMVYSETGDARPMIAALRKAAKK